MILRDRSVKTEKFSDMEFDLYNNYKLNNKINELYRLFVRYQDIDVNIPLPRITTDYQIKYEQFVKGTKSSKVENYVFKKMYIESRIEENRIEFLTKFTMALKSLTELELQVFDKSFYEQKTDLEIASDINYCEKTVRKTKKSAYIRLLTNLGLDHECFNLKELEKVTN